MKVFKVLLSLHLVAIAAAAAAAATVKMADPVVPMVVNKNMFVAAESSIGGRKEMEDFIILKNNIMNKKFSREGLLQYAMAMVVRKLLSMPSTMEKHKNKSWL